MIHALGALVVTDHHVDMSFDDTTDWPRHGTGLPRFNIPPTAYAAFFVGDPVSGPLIELVAASANEANGYLLTHLHRCDTFRISLRGEMIMTPSHFGPGAYEFLESGRHYTQGFGPSPAGQWTFLVTADRRGKHEKFANPKKAEEFMAEYMKARQMAPVTQESASDPDEFIPVSFPEDSSGVPAIATTIGTTQRGVLDGSFAGEDWASALDGTRWHTALLGDVVSGPVVLLLQADQGEVAVPELTSETETTFCIVRGSASCGDIDYRCGWTRLQEAGATMPALVAGPEGCDAVLVIADRRAGMSCDLSHGGGAPWLDEFAATVTRLQKELETTVGASV